MTFVYPKAYFKGAVVPTDEVTVSVTSAAVLYGLSIYTVFLVVPTDAGFGAFSLDKHYRRLVNSSRIIGMDAFEKEWPQERFEAAVKELVRENAPKETALVRATVHVVDTIARLYPNGFTTALSMFMYEAKPLLPQSGARLKTSVWRRNPDVSIPSRAKVNGGYVNTVLAKQEAKRAGYDDALLLGIDGQVTELTAANVFLVRGGELITPANAHDLLEGVTRATIFDIAKREGIVVHERAVDLTELYVADEVFACGTSAFIAPVIEIDGRTIGNGTPGPVTKKLQEKYGETLSANGSGLMPLN